MIQEDFVSFETARLLKKKGFSERCAHYYEGTNMWRHYYDEVLPNKPIYECPTIQLALKWLREKGLYILVDFDVDYDEGENGCRKYHTPEWYYNVYLLCDGTQITDNGVSVESCEKAYEEGIKYCLENLF